MLGVYAYLTVAILLGVYISFQHDDLEFPEDFYGILGFCLCWLFSVPYELWKLKKEDR